MPATPAPLARRPLVLDPYTGEYTVLVAMS